MQGHLEELAISGLFLPCFGTANNKNKEVYWQLDTIETSSQYSNRDEIVLYLGGKMCTPML
ncbi:hypothetical protein FHS18_005548 [Paenibacillus phyllosphaerae]|uniref:Uncharacterized protein n=1 Tax=Paenibacillus phyllosphaerae TaxID=274593 RepID=A0A7W5B4A2_9BACL|nr:hypothetical protein [Paenibacillus phyllosphaerae]MBB3113436.1 hypothetical protein [Paenibacillus phyllosphaerae]